IADKFNHHPDICVHNKRSVRLTCWTRQMHCLTRVDFDLAEAFSAVHDEQCSQQVAR
ncbi:4a-hydroxytetrahydrobiopterin dehydratase, partial [Mycobacterium tuberculosis]